MINQNIIADMVELANICNEFINQTEETKPTTPQGAMFDGFNNL